MKKSYKAEVRMSEELARKLLYISAAEGRTPNNQFLFMLRGNIQYFERTKGKITPDKLAAVDLSQFELDPPAEKLTEKAEEK